MPTTFKVNDVEPCPTGLPPAPIDAIVKHRCGGVVPEAWSVDKASKAVEEMPGLARRIGIDNGLVSAVHSSWSSHYPLVLSPDMIWLCIAQGLAQHVNLNAEKLRSKFVEHEGKKEILLKRADIKKGSPSNPWPAVFEEFSEQIRRNVGGKTHDILTPTFSTTGPVEKAAAQVVLMDTFKQYFSYGMVCICGIPEITLEGTVEDWIKLREKALLLTEYDLEWWTKALKPVLDQFVAAASGKVDHEFWCKIYNQYGGGAYKPGPFITGWILSFFPYTRGYQGSKRNEFLTLWQNTDPASHGGVKTNEQGPGIIQVENDGRGLTHHQFTPGISSTPFTLQVGDIKYPMHFYAGFMHISQDPRTLAIRPEIGWAVADHKDFEDAKIMSGRRRF